MHPQIAYYLALSRMDDLRRQVEPHGTRELRHATTARRRRRRKAR